MKFLNFLLGGLSSLIFQFFYGGFLYLFLNLTALFYHDNRTSLFIETFIFAGLYGAGWFFYWKISPSLLNILEPPCLSKKELIWDVLMATLPLIVPLLLFNPSPSPKAMIPPSFEEYRYHFMLLVTTIVLFPIYSLLLVNYVFSSKTNQVKKTAFTFTLIFLIGIGSAYTSWSIMPLIYKSF